MSSSPSPPDDPAPVRPFAGHVRRGHVVALSAVAAAAFGLLGLRAVELPQPRPIDEADRLRIEVVHPVEPEIVPGSVMEVGELVDGFQGLPPPEPRPAELEWSYDDGWEDLEAARPAPRPVAAVFTPEPPPRREPPPRYESRWFGFDAPRPDYEAQRAARRARLEAMERRAHELREARRREWADRRDQWLSRQDGPRPYRREGGWISDRRGPAGPVPHGPPEPRPFPEPW